MIPMATRDAQNSHWLRQTLGKGFKPRALVLSVRRSNLGDEVQCLGLYIVRRGLATVRYGIKNRNPESDLF